MEKKILFGSILAIVMLVLVSFSPIIYASTPQNEALKTISIEITGLNKETSIELNTDEVDLLKNIISQFNEEFNEIDNINEVKRLYKDTIQQMSDVGIFEKEDVNTIFNLAIGTNKNITDNPIHPLSEIQGDKWTFVSGYIGEMISASVIPYLLFIAPYVLAELIFLLAMLLYKYDYNVYILQIIVLILFGFSEFIWNYIAEKEEYSKICPFYAIGGWGESSSHWVKIFRLRKIGEIGGKFATQSLGFTGIILKIPVDDDNEDYFYLGTSIMTLFEQD